MGNLASCTSASVQKSVSSFAANDAPPKRPVPSLTPPQPHRRHKSVVKNAKLVVRVLRVDGSVLQFKQKLKVMRVLMDYPNHFICALDSLRPGQHSLSSLLPHEELQLGHLYLLLPLHHHSDALHTGSINQKRNPKAVVPSYDRLNNDQHQHQHQHQHPQHLMQRSKSSSSRYHGSSEGSSSEGMTSLTKMIQKSKQQVRAVDHCDDDQLQALLTYNNSLTNRPCSCTADHCPDQYTSKHGQRHCTQYSVDVGRKYHVTKSSKHCRQSCSDGAVSVGRWHALSIHQLDRKDRAVVQDNNQQLGYMNILNTRLCDTAELQMAYKSDMLRRCRTWTPRLHAITETTSISTSKEPS